MVWGCKQVGSSGMCFLLFEGFHFTLNGRCSCTEPHQASAALLCCPSLSTRNLCLEEGDTSAFESWTEGQTHRAQNQTICISWRLWSSEGKCLFPHFFFRSSHQMFLRPASRSAAPAVSVSVQSYHWQVLTTVFLRCAAWRGWGKAVFFWQWVVHAVSSDGRVSEAVFVPGCHMASKEKCSCRCCFRPECWEHCEAVSSGQTVVSLLRKEIHC